MTVADLTARLTGEFTPNQARLLAESFNDSYQNLVKTSDFNELKEIVRDILVIQKRTEVKVEELAEAQKRTEVKVEELAEAQKQTEIQVARLTEVQRETRQTLGSVTGTLGMWLENEAYRNLPGFLERKHDITVTNRMIREYVDGEEIDILAEGKRGETEVLIVAESKNTLAAEDLALLKRKVEAVKTHYEKLNGREIVPLMVVHRARDKEIQRANNEGVIVVRSYEW
ncbi:MAG: hypothetical protein ACREEM_16155 [Blastocatellia bacterium]